MGRVYEELDDRLRAFIASQQMFFVATAPLSAEGHVNLSPKGLDSIRVLDAHTAAYVDLHGSGIETVAHVRENGRITLMFCAFSGRPPSAGGLNRPSRHVPVHIEGPNVSVCAFA